MADEPLYCTSCGGEMGIDCTCPGGSHGPGDENEGRAEPIQFCHLCGDNSPILVCGTCLEDLRRAK